MRAPDPLSATRSGAVLHLGAGVLLLGVAGVDHRASRLAVVGLALVALAVGVVLLALSGWTRRRLEVAFVADLVALGLVAGVVAATGGADSAYSPFYLLAIVHTAVFQSRARLLMAALTAIVLLFIPMAYDPDTGRFLTLAVTGLLPAVAAAAVTHGAVQAMREESRRLVLREAEALRIAESDPLTGVGNYRMFRRSLEKELARARRHDQPFSLIILDLDGFKAINDELGHQVGDEALQRVARALRSALRTEDVLCRHGGDEFGVIAVQAAHRQAAELVRRLRTAVEGVRLPGLSRPLSVTAGWATFAEPVRNAEGMLARADRELRAAKRRRPEPERVAAAQRRAPSRPHLPLDPRLATLSDCARTLALAADEREVVQLAVTQLVGALDASVVEIWKREPVSGQPVLAARARESEGRRSSGTAADPGVISWVMRTNRVAVVPVADPDAPGPGHANAVATDLLAPITSGGHVRGALRARLDRPGGGSPRERQLALSLAAQVGLAQAAAAARARLADAEPGDLPAHASTLPGARSAERVADLATAIAHRLRMPDEEREALRLAALVHRLGMVGVPAGLPLRPDPLSDAEREVLQQHPVIAEELLVAIPALRRPAAILRHASERNDGQGYPDGLAGDEIPLSSRVLHAAIAFVAMSSDRPYRAALADAEALDELGRAARSGQLDPRVVEAMLEVLEGRPPAWVSQPAPR